MQDPCLCDGPRYNYECIDNRRFCLVGGRASLCSGPFVDLPNACPCTSWPACLHSQLCVPQCLLIPLQGGYIKACPAGTYCMGSNNGENPCKPLLQATPSPCPNGENW